MEDQTHRADLIVKHAGPTGLEDYTVECEECSQEFMVSPKSPPGFYMTGVLRDKYPRGNGVRYSCKCPHCSADIRPDVTSKVRQRNCTGDVRKPETFRGLVRGNLWDSVHAGFSESTKALAENTAKLEAEYQSKMEAQWGDRWAEVEFVSWRDQISMTEAFTVIYKEESDGS